MDFDDVKARAASTSTPRHRNRAVWAIAATVIAVLAVAVVVALPRGATTAAPAHQRPVDYSKLVLRDGDTVTASGDVVAIPGHATQLCDPYEVVATPTNTGRTTACGTGVDLVGIDLATLTSRRALGGSVTGRATITGVYRGSRITVTRQERFRGYPKTSFTDFRHAPCSAPVGGWPPGPQSMLDPVETYSRAHPGSIVTEAELQPTPRSAIAYVLTAGDPEPVRRALTAAFGKRLCVVRSAYSRDQIAAARRVLELYPPTAAGITGSGEGLSDGLQPQVDAQLRQLPAELAARLARQPAGLIKLTIWLTPAR